MTVLLKKQQQRRFYNVLNQIGHGNAFFIALLIICMLVKAIADQQKQMLVLKRKNAALTLEMNQREDILGLEADFEAILDDK